MPLTLTPAGRSVPSGTVLRVYLLTAGGAALWLAAVFLAPYLAARGSGRAAGLLYAVFSPVCHQIPERCFAFHGHPLAVCGRCLGIYAGFAAGLVLYPFVRGFARLALPGAGIFLALTLPMALDGVAGVLGLWNSPIALRFATGTVWGALLPFYFVTGVAELAASGKRGAETGALVKEPGKNIE